MSTTSTTNSGVFHRSLHKHPFEAARTEGNYIYLTDGHKILDASGGAAVSCIGHNDKRVVAGMIDQIQTIDFLHSGTYTYPVSEELADELIRSSGMKKVLFVSGGSEAVESAIKLVRQYHVENKQPERVNFIAREQSYHGNTLGALSLSGHKSRRALFLPLFGDNFHHVSPCYAYRYKLPEESDETYVKRLAEELEAKFQELGPHTVAAFFAETVVGATSGCTPAVSGYFKAMREVCDKYGVLLVLDEIMCGIGRTGKMHAWEWENLSSPPDIQIIGKGLGGGYAALAAVLASKKVIDVFEAGSGSFVNGYTYQAHPVACRAALEIFKILKEDNLVEQCLERGILLENTLKEQLAVHPHVGDIRLILPSFILSVVLAELDISSDYERQKETIFCIQINNEFVKDKETKEMYPTSMPVADSIVAACFKQGVAVYPGAKGTFNGINGDHILVAPPYTITEQEILLLVDTIKISVDTVLCASA